MTTHAERSIALADKLTAKATESLSSLEREMIIMKWPAEFRVIMWEAVIAVAQAHIKETRP